MQSQNIGSSSSNQATRAWDVQKKTRAFSQDTLHAWKVSYQIALGQGTLAQPSILVIQDTRIRIPPEFLFGKTPGDCLAIQALLTKPTADVLEQIEFLAKTYQLSQIVVALPQDFATHKTEVVSDFIEQVKELCPGVKSQLLNDILSIEGCLVDESSQNIIYV